MTFTMRSLRNFLIGPVETSFSCRIWVSDVFTAELVTRVMILIEGTTEVNMAVIEQDIDTRILAIPDILITLATILIMTLAAVILLIYLQMMRRIVLCNGLTMLHIRR